MILKSKRSNIQHYLTKRTKTKVTNFNTASKVCKFPGLLSCHSIFIAILLKLQITTVHTLKCCYLKLEKNCIYIGGGDTRPLKSVAIVFNLTVLSNTKMCQNVSKLFLSLPKNKRWIVLSFQGRFHENMSILSCVYICHVRYL